jgi:hypothetical protein
MKWDIPPIIKIYEALGAIGDERVAINGNKAKVSSSSGNKFYDVEYDPAKNAITSNDNGSFWKGYLGYPAIAFLMIAGRINYDTEYANALKGIAWKDINTKYKNDFSKTIAEVHRVLGDKGVDLSEFLKVIESIAKKVKSLDIGKLENTQQPPNGY